MRLARFVPRLILLLGSALGLTACSEEGPADLRWEINFKCTSDARRTDSVRVRVLRDACGGTDQAYDTTLMSGQAGPEKVIEPGDYNLEVTALNDLEVPVAYACKPQRFPAEHLEIWLTTDACDREVAAMDSGLSFIKDADVEEESEDAEIVTPPPDDAAVPENCGVNPGKCACSTFGGRSYLMCPDSVSWTEARKRCKALGTDLAVIDSPEENAHIVAKAGGMTRWMGAHDRGDNGVGTSLGPACDATCRKPINAAEGTWKWIDPVGGGESGATFCTLSTETNQCPASVGKYANWAAGEPNNVHEKKCQYPADECAEGEDCAAIGGSGTWQDAECKVSLPFVCETR